MSIPRTVLHALHDRALRQGDRPALWTRKDGHYVPRSWRQYLAQVESFARGLKLQGLRAGESVGIWSGNREEWLVGNLAAMSLGAIPVGCYANLSPEQLEYLLHHAEATFVLVEGRAQLDVLAKLRSRLPRLREVIVMDAVPSDQAAAKSFEVILAQGAQSREEVDLDRLQPEALATLIYTSGTTGHPKGVMLSHANLVWTAAQLASTLELGTADVALSYLPLSHIAEQLASIYLPLVAGMQVYFAGSIDSLAEDLTAVRPTLFLGVPRVWEKLKAKLESALDALPPRQRQVLARARARALERHRQVEAGGRVHRLVQLEYALARSTAFPSVKRKLGFERTRTFVTAAAPIGREVLEFFASLDIRLQEIYGLSEVTGPATVSTASEMRLGSAGQPMPGLELRLADDGEVLVRGPNVCQGYFKDASATRDLLKDGWLHTGDVGVLDGEGFLWLTGRKKEIIVTSGGKKTAPATLEAMLKDVSPISQAVVVGDGRQHLAALVTLDATKARELARARGWPEDLGKLAEDARFLGELQDAVDRQVNSRVSRFETLKKLAVLPEDFSVETGELTPTLKVKRSLVLERHRARIDALYDRKSR